MPQLFLVRGFRQNLFLNGTCSIFFIDAGRKMLRITDLQKRLSLRRSNMLRILLLYWKQDGWCLLAKDRLEKHVFLKVFIKVRNEIMDKAKVKAHNKMERAIGKGFSGIGRVFEGGTKS